MQRMQLSTQCATWHELEDGLLRAYTSARSAAGMPEPDGANRHLRNLANAGAFVGFKARWAPQRRNGAFAGGSVVAPLVWSHLPRTRQIYATKVHVRSTWHDCTLEEGVRVKSNIEICHELYE